MRASVVDRDGNLESLDYNHRYRHHYYYGHYNSDRDAPGYYLLYSLRGQ